MFIYCGKLGLFFIKYQKTMPITLPICNALRDTAHSQTVRCNTIKMKLNTQLLLALTFVLVGCSEEEGVVIEERICAIGTLNGEPMKMTCFYYGATQDSLKFSLEERREKVGCPHTHISILGLPRQTGEFVLINTGQGTKEKGIRLFGGLFCGDAVYGFYDLDTTAKNTIRVDSIKPQLLYGELNATFDPGALADTIGDSILVIENMRLEIEL